MLAGDGIGPEIMRQALRVIEFFDRRHLASFEISEGLVG
ncbi:MAG TPA: 3-isopropylmalate dehydrogenase, partial [Stellaceae bacterium]|nr:3-isopropylmalate dehydrogenase [Stellaceae bacterium]